MKVFFFFSASRFLAIVKQNTFPSLFEKIFDMGYCIVYHYHGTTILIYQMNLATPNFS